MKAPRSLSPLPGIIISPRPKEIPLSYNTASRGIMMTHSLCDLPQSIPHRRCKRYRRDRSGCCFLPGAHQIPMPPRLLLHRASWTGSPASASFRVMVVNDAPVHDGRYRLARCGLERGPSKQSKESFLCGWHRDDAWVRTPLAALGVTIREPPRRPYRICCPASCGACVENAACRSARCASLFLFFWVAKLECSSLGLVAWRVVQRAG